MDSLLARCWRMGSELDFAPGAAARGRLSAFDKVPRPTPMYWISSSGSSGGWWTWILGVNGGSMGFDSSDSGDREVGRWTPR